jgi:hypothetical protein
VVSIDGELMTLKHKAEMPYAEVTSQQLAVKCAVFDLGWLQLLGEEAEGLPGGCWGSMLLEGVPGSPYTKCKK